MISFARRADGVSTGSVSGSATTTEQVTALVEAADAAARAGSPAEDAADLVGGDSSPDWDERRRDDLDRRLRRVRPGAGRGVRPRRRRGPAALRLRQPRRHHDLPRLLQRPAPAPRPADRPLRLHRQGQPTSASSAWVGGATRDFRDVDAAAMAAELAQRLVLGRAPHRPSRRALRHDPAARLGRRPDDRRLLGAGARVAHEGESVYSRRGGGTRIGDKVAAPGVHLFSDPTYAGLELRAVRGGRPPRPTPPASSTTGCRSSAPTGSGTAC